jgi:multidrug efflux pump subunit AcrA (membrane-fusion protein)
MKNPKLLFAVIISFVVGFNSSRFLLKKEAPAQEAVNQSEEKIHHEGEEVHVNKGSQQLLGIETVEVRKASLTTKIEVTGQIAQDVENVINVLSSQSGIMIECRTQVGSVVRKEDVICLIKDEDNDSVTKVRSPREGVVIADFYKVGDKVNTVSPVHTIADFSKLWANFDVYEKDFAQVKIGQDILVYSMAYPNQVFEGKIVFISPRVDETSRTIKIRAAVQNPKSLLKLGMFVNADIVSQTDEEYLMAPSSAVQALGDKKIVFLRVDEGKFQPKEVVIKAETKDQTAISDGVREGDWIVGKGAFLLKSTFLADQLKEE